MGDVRRLEGRTIEIVGAVKLYDGRPEIILNRINQITGGAALIPPLPKNYDVENRGLQRNPPRSKPHLPLPRPTATMLRARNGQTSGCSHHTLAQ
ncbi:MAG TPA: hypothetical protein VIX37_17205, partial [Candidatus Sulfotelmatobacter sp.]